MLVSDFLSSPRVPLSVVVALATSATMSSIVFASLSQAPVQVVSPIDLNLTFFFSTFS